MGRLDKVLANKAQRQKRSRAKLRNNSDLPRLSVFISNTHVSAQVIDDENSKTLVSASTVGKTKIAANLTERAVLVGELIADGCAKQKITKVVLDRGSKQYHGRIKALAEAAREKGLEL